MAAQAVRPILAERITVAEAGERLLQHLEALGLRLTTLSAYRASVRPSGA